MTGVRPLSSELQKIAEVELNEVPSRIEEDIKHLREWIVQQPHINGRTDNQCLLNFLRGSKFSLQRAKEKLDMFYAMRTHLPEFFSNRNPFLPEMQEVLKLGIMLPLPKTFGNNRLVLTRFGKLNMNIPYTAVVKLVLMVIDILFNEDDNFIICGQHVICDAKGASLEYLLTANVNVVKKFEVCLEKGYPTRPQAFDVINAPLYFETVYNMLKPLLSEKIKERINIYGEKNSDSIFKNIPHSHLPKEYGGDGESLAELTVYWKQKVESYKDWFMEDAQYCSDESKRSVKLISDEMFGNEGSFRKLDVD